MTEEREHEYRCTCGWRGEKQALAVHPRQGFGVCPRCWSAGIERMPDRWEPIGSSTPIGEQLELATDAIAYALRRVGTDAEFAYHMLFTETLDRLIRAYARITGRDPTNVRDQIMERTRALPKSRCEADKEFIDGGGNV